MNLFVLRNSTIENLFNSGNVRFSGYEDISYIDPKADYIVWFYLLPFNPENRTLCSVINSYINTIELLYSQISQDKIFIIFTIQNSSIAKYINSDFSVESAISKFNQDIYNFSTLHSNIKVIDFSDFTKKYTFEQLVDWKYYFISKMQINPRLSFEFNKWFFRKMEEIQLKRKKCLVLDLDNTLWGGILGEDGINGIKIGGDYPGNAFQMFQKYLIELSKNGVILTICSKNNEKDVFNAWEQNPYILLKNEHISAFRINWNNKSDNIKELAEELNIGLDSFVFIDDNPSERELIRQILPMVEVPDFPQKPYLLPSFALSLLEKYFRVYSLTSEDLKKTEQYKANSERAQVQRKFTDFTEYLKSLQMNLTIESASSLNISRVAQMTQKTNQFNLTTRRYTEADIQSYVNKKNYVFCLSVKDKFGDNGITGCIIIKDGPNDRIVDIDSLLLSCRVLGKGIEFAFVKKVLDILKSKGIEQVISHYIPSDKNAQVADFYDKIGFTLIHDGEEFKKNGEKKYGINLSNKQFDIESYYYINVI